MHIKEIGDLAKAVVSDKLVELRVPAPKGTEPTLFLWFVLYMQLEVIGVKAKSTEDTKWQDMKGFMTWYSDTNGHLLAENWLKRDTAGYLDSLETLGRKPATINRAFRTIRTFVRWMQKRPDHPLVDDPVHVSMERRQQKREPSKLADPVM